MGQKIKKAQVVIAAVDQTRQSFQFLLLQTNRERGEFWQNVTGKIEENETIEEGALREAIEETQLKVESIVDIQDLNLNFEFVDGRKREVYERSFLIIADTAWDFKFDPKEHQGYRWVKLDEVKRDSVKFHTNFEALEKSKNLLRHWGI